jgi:ribonuclease P protein component
MPLPRLTRRSEYLRVAAAGRKWVAPGLILQVLRREAGGAPDGRDAAILPPGVAVTGPTVRLGFTASRKVGIAVRRNRARRRLRAAAAQIMPCHAAPGHDYVLIARAGTPSRPYATLVEDLRTALRRLGVYCEGDGAAGSAA